MVEVAYVADTHRAALIAAKVQAVSTFFHANEAKILPKGIQSRKWSPYIEFNMASSHGLGARAVFDVVDKKIFLVGHYDDGGNYELLTNVPAEVTDSFTDKAMTQLKYLCVGTQFESLAEWTTAGNLSLLWRSLDGNFKRTGDPTAKSGAAK